MGIIAGLAAIGTSLGMTAGTTSAAVVGGISLAATAAGMAQAGFSVASGIDQANQAAKQRRRENAMQDKAITKEEVADRRTKAKKKASNFQREREAALGTSEQSLGKGTGSSSKKLGSAPSASGGPANVGRGILGG